VENDAIFKLVTERRDSREKNYLALNFDGDDDGVSLSMSRAWKRAFRLRTNADEAKLTIAGNMRAPFLHHECLKLFKQIMR